LAPPLGVTSAAGVVSPVTVTDSVMPARLSTALASAVRPSSTTTVCVTVCMLGSSNTTA